MDILELLSNPDSYFGRHEVGVKFPIAVLGGMAICSLVVAILRTTAIAQSMEGVGAQATIAVVGLASVVAATFTPFVTCLVYAVVIFGLARFLGGAGSFRRTFWSVGHGYLPALLGSILVAGATAVAVFDVAPPTTAEQISVFTSRVNAHPAYQFAHSVNVATLVWSGYLWLFATKYVHDLDELDSLVAVGVPTILTLALTVFDVL